MRERRGRRGDNTERKLKERPNKEIGTGEQRNINKLNGKKKDTYSRGGQHHHRLHFSKTKYAYFLPLSLQELMHVNLKRKKENTRKLKNHPSTLC